MPMESRPRPELPPQAVAALNAGSKIAAIKIVRTTQGVDLKTAKEIVDSYVATDPVMQLSWKARQAETRGSRRVWLVIVVLLALLAVYYFRHG
jgi:hypothetical protein